MRYSSDLVIHREFSYRIEYSGRRTISIIVSPYKGVVVRAPYLTSSRIIEKFVNEKSEWINKTLSGFNSLKKLDDISYSTGDKILFEGKEHNLQIKRTGRNYVRLIDGNAIEVGINGQSDPVLIKAILEMWLKNVARKKLAVRFMEILTRYSRYGFSPTGFNVRTMKKRWGSCSSQGKIAISYDLIRLDDIFAEYVIIHELCHLKHHNHSKEYYKFLTELYPEWKNVRNQLKFYIR